MTAKDTKDSPVSNSPENADIDRSAERLGAKLLPVSIAALLTALLMRLFVSGVQASIADPWNNAFIDGLLLLSTLLYTASKYFCRGSQSAFEAVSWRVPPIAFWLFALISLFLGLTISGAANSDLAVRGTISVFALGFGLVMCLDIIKTPAQAFKLLSIVLAISLCYCVMAVFEVFVEHPLTVSKLKDPAFLATVPPQFREELQARFNTRAASAAFLIPNLAACAFVIAWPIWLVVAISGFRTQKKPRLIAGVAGLVFCAVGMLLTKSKGFVPASGFALWTLIFLWPESESADSISSETLLGKLIKRRRQVLVALGLIGVVLVGVGLAAYFRDPEAYGVGLSLKVRFEYWQAGWNMFTERPWFGAGLNNYQEFYSQFKPERSEETRYAHNTVVQLLADHGLVGTILLLGCIGLILKTAVMPVKAQPQSSTDDAAETKPETESEYTTQPDITGGVVALSLTGLLVLMISLPVRWNPLTAGSGLEIALSFGLLASCLIVLWSAFKLSDSLFNDIPHECLIAALAAGFVGFLGHSLLDFSFHSHGLWTLAGLAIVVAIRLRPNRPETQGPAHVLTLIGLLLVAAYLVLSWAPKMQTYQSFYEGSRQTWQEVAGRQSAGEQIDPDLIKAIIADAEQAAEIYPNSRVFRLLATIHLSQFRINQQIESLKAAQQAILIAISHRPHSAGLQKEASEIFLELSVALAKQKQPKQVVSAAFQRSLQFANTAVVFYPTHPQYQFELAQRWRQGYSFNTSPAEQSEAKANSLKHFQLALKYDKLARLKRVQLSETQRRMAIEQTKQ